MKRNFFHRYLSAKVLPIWTILLIDVFIIVISSMLAYALRYDFRSIFFESSTIDKTILWTVAVNLIFFRVFRTYSKCAALFLLCGYHANFCVIDCVVCTADDNECPDGKLFGV